MHFSKYTVTIHITVSKCTTDQESEISKEVEFSQIHFCYVKIFKYQN